MVNGETSSDADVEADVPQGTVLGPLLFLCHIKDLPDRVKSTVRMFADDCLIYRGIKSRADQIQLQHDLLALQEWADSWGMRFNAEKCLGVMWQQDLSWSTYIKNICGKADNTLAFL